MKLKVVKIQELLERINTWWESLGKRDKILMLVFLALIPVVFYFLEIQTMKEEVDKLKKEKQRLHNELVRLERKKRKAKELQSLLIEIEKIAKEAEKYLPSKQEISGLLTEISKEQEKFNIILLTLKAEKEIYHENLYAEIPFQTKISGNFRNTMLFLDNLRKKDRLLNIENFVIKKEKGRLITECQISTYRFLSKEERKSLEEKVKGKKRRKKK